MATPNYKGAGQPSSRGSWLGSWLGGTPAYTNVDKRASYTGAGPAYKPAPATAESPDAATAQVAQQSDACGPGPIAIVIPREVIEQQ